MRRPDEVYRALLNLLPEHDRRQAEAEMLEVFREADADARSRGRTARLRFWSAAVADVALTAASARWAGMRRTTPGGGVAGDVRLALRQLRKHPLVSAVVVSTLALAIGANTVVFSIARTLLVEPLPVERIDRVVSAFASKGGDPFQISPLDYAAWTEHARSFASLGIARAEGIHLSLHGERRRIAGAAVTPDYLDTLGVEPHLGRRFVEEDARASVALVGFGLWQDVFGGVPNVVGREIVVGGRAHTIVGVLPRGFDLPFATSIWTPMEMEALTAEERASRDYFLAARLSEGTSPRQAEEELSAIARELERKHPRTHEGWGVRVLPLRRLLLDDFDGHLVPSLAALAAAVLFLLLIACANVGNLLLAQSLGRRRELALRRALGASRARLVQQILVEGSALAALSGVLGAILARASLPLLVVSSPGRPVALADFFYDVRVDEWALAFTALLTVGAGLGLGLVPAWRLGETKLAASLNEGERTGGSSSSRRLMRGVAVAEVGLAVALAVAAGLMVRSFEKLSAIDLGFEPDGISVLRLSLSDGERSDHGRRNALVEELLERARALPGVRSAGVTTNVPLDHLSWDAAYLPRDAAPDEMGALLFAADRVVSPGYLETLGVELVAGRLIDETDVADGRPVVVVTEDLARRALPGQDPVGAPIRRLVSAGEISELTVVGVVAPVKEDRSAFRTTRPAAYVPYTQNETDRPLAVVVRKEPGAASPLPEIRRAVAAAAPGLPLYDATTMSALLADLLARERFSALLVAVFAGFGLLLAALGIYGVLSFAVQSRTREIGLRMALGASRQTVLGGVVGEGLWVTATGLVLGIAGGVAAGRIVGSFLFEVSPLDPASLAIPSLVILAVSLAASASPARRATRVDPLTVLR